MTEEIASAEPEQAPSALRPRSSGGKAAGEVEGAFRHGDRTIRYVFRPAATPGAPLLVLLHGHSTSPRASKFRSPNWNILCPIDDFGLKGAGSWYLGEAGNHFWLDAMPELIRSLHAGSEIYFLGSSMGGYGAILHGIRCGARAIYANIPQTVLLGSTYATQGMRAYFEAAFGEKGPDQFNDLKNLLHPGIQTTFLLTGLRHDKERYLAEQTLPFVQALLEHDLTFGLEILPGEGHTLAIPIAEAVKRLEAYRSKTADAAGAPPVPPAAEPAPLAAPAVAPEQITPLEGDAASAEALARDILLGPEAFWTGDKAHMAPRFEGFLQRFQKRSGLRSREAVAQAVLRAARNRMAARPLTVFIVNPGSSGSHWLQDALARAAGTNPCGEVYVPPAVMAAMRKLDGPARGLLLDCMHIAHSYHPEQDLESAVFVNTAHGSGWPLSKAMPDPKHLMLLTRDPLDVVISRTFRKPDHRERFFPGRSDGEYLELNIAYVRKFYDNMAQRKPDSIVRYEDMKADLGQVMRRLREATNLPITEAGIEAMLRSYDSADSSVSTNQYKGPKVSVPQHHVDEARRALADIRTSLGYD